MSLIWREFERKCRALYRAELRGSPDLRREVRRQRKNDNKLLNHVARRVLLPLFWGSIFFSLAAKQTNQAAPAAAIALWAAGTAFRWGHHWFQQFYASEDLVVLNFLPLDDSSIFRVQLRRYISAAGWLFWELGIAYLALAFVDPADALPVFHYLIAGVLQALLVVALALHLASWAHFLPLGSLGGLLRLTAFALMIFSARPTEAGTYFTQATEWFLPTGWINYALLRGPSDPAVYGLALPLLALIYLARYSFDRLRSFYSLAGVEIVPSRATGPEHEELTHENISTRPGPTEIEDRILARNFLAGLNWEHAGPLERFAARCLTPRERVVTEFLVAGDPGWTSGLKVSFWIWAVTCMVVLLLGQFGGTIIFFAGYVLATTTLPLFGGDWRGMRQTASGGVYLPAYSLYPITFNSIAAVFLKVNLIRIAVAAPFILTFSMIAAQRLDQNPIEGVLFAAKVLAILACIQPLLVVFPISRTSNDTARARIIYRVPLLIPALVVVVAAMLVVFFSQDWLWVSGGFVVAVAGAVLVLLSYRAAYRKGKFDLLTDRSPGG